MRGAFTKESFGPVQWIGCVGLEFGLFSKLIMLVVFLRPCGVGLIPILARGPKWAFARLR